MAASRRRRESCGFTDLQFCCNLRREVPLLHFQSPSGSSDKLRADEAAAAKKANSAKTANRLVSWSTLVLRICRPADCALTHHHISYWQSLCTFEALGWAGQPGLWREPAEVPRSAAKHQGSAKAPKAVPCESAFFVSYLKPAQTLHAIRKIAEHIDHVLSATSTRMPAARLFMYLSRSQACSPAIPLLPPVQAGEQKVHNSLH